MSNEVGELYFANASLNIFGMKNYDNDENNLILEWNGLIKLNNVEYGCEISHFLTNIT